MKTILNYLFNQLFKNKEKINLFLNNSKMMKLNHYLKLFNLQSSYYLHNFLHFQNVY